MKKCASQESNQKACPVEKENSFCKKFQYNYVCWDLATEEIFVKMVYMREVETAKKLMMTVPNRSYNNLSCKVSTQSLMVPKKQEMYLLAARPWLIHVGTSVTIPDEFIGMPLQSALQKRDAVHLNYLSLTHAAYALE